MVSFQQASASDLLLTASRLYYQPFDDTTGDQFCLILSTPQQQATAWEHGHRQQMLMDDTFGVCSARILLFILMVINKQNKGIPVAAIMFTARKEAKATHTNYNTELLKDLLAHWKAGMGKHPQTGEEFIISVVNTDNDPHERNVLSL